MSGDLATWPTPALVLDASRLTRNAQRMRARARDLGVWLRPHLKTTKCAEIAARILDGAGATVSTLREAEYFAAHGVRDLVLASCVPGSKLDRAAALVDAGVTLRLLTDDPEVARAIARHSSPLSCLIEVDCGGERTGVPPDGDALPRIADALGERLAGVLTHAGHSYSRRSPAAIADVAERERASVVLAAERLNGRGWPSPLVSVGSTPTAVHARHLEGVTEMRPGVYAFGDLFQVAIGSCALEDVALSVLATVISRSGGRTVIDAGGLALSKDRSTQSTIDDAGYGRVCDLELQPLSAGARVADVHQEHGLLEGTPDSLRVGDRVRVLPNHACMTAAAYPAYAVVDAGTSVIAEWSRVNGW